MLADDGKLRFAIVRHQVVRNCFRVSGTEAAAHLDFSGGFGPMMRPVFQAGR
jgi:hypothetical protein